MKKDRVKVTLTETYVGYVNVEFDDGLKTIEEKIEELNNNPEHESHELEDLTLIEEYVQYGDDE